MAGNEKRRSSIRSKMIFYFFLIAFANVFVTLEFIMDIRSDEYKEQIDNVIELVKVGAKPTESVHAEVTKIVRKFSIMLVVLIAISASVLYMFVVQIASPIQYMIDKATVIADGDLSATIQIKSEDELSVLGNLINDLNANLQEIIAQLKQIQPDLEHIHSSLNHKLSRYPELRPLIEEDSERVGLIATDLMMLKEAFTLYQIGAADGGQEPNA